MKHPVVFGAIALDDPSSLRVADVRSVVERQLFLGLEIAVAKDCKRRGNVPLPDSDDGITRFHTVVSGFATGEKKVVSLLTIVGSEPSMQRFTAGLSQFLARVVTRLPLLNLAPMPVKSAKAGQAPQPVPPVVVSTWITPVAELLFSVVIESIMAFWLKPATMDAAIRLSLDNAQAAIRSNISEEELSTVASLVVMRRQADLKLIYAASKLQDAVLQQIAASDLLAHLPGSIKAKITLFDDAARMGGDKVFEERLCQAGNEAICVAQLAAWALAVKADKAELAQAVKRQVAALGPPLAAVPPPPAGQAEGRRGNHCFTCEHAGRPTTHPRETCEHYKCYGCKKVAPGHLYRNCPDPSIGGPCPPHRN